VHLHVSEHGKNMPTICYGQSEINENTANV